MAALAIRASAVLCSDAMGIIGPAPCHPGLGRQSERRHPGRQIEPRDPGYFASRSSGMTEVSLRSLLQEGLARADDGELDGLVGEVERAVPLARHGEGGACQIALAREVLAIVGAA